MSSEHKTDAILSVESLREVGWGDLSLRPYQLEGVNWLVNCYEQGHGCILGDEMGLGKTCQTIALLTYLNSKNQECCRPHLVVCPRSVLENWEAEFGRFSPKMKTLCFVGDKDLRNQLTEKLRKSRKGSDKYDFDVLITTYELCLKDHLFLKAIPWNTLVVDEAHRLKNHESLLYKTLEEWDMTCSILLTGTPVQNNLKELYALLSFIAPRQFRLSRLDRFVENYHNTEKEEGLEELHTLLKPYLLRRTKACVLKDLPKKSEVVLYHGLSQLQKKLYKAILTKDLEMFNNNNTVTATRLMNVVMQLRKCVNHPYLFNGVEPEPFLLGEHLIEASGKLILIDRLLIYLKKAGHKVLLFSQMTHMLDVLQDYLGYRDFKYERLDGSVRGEERFLSVRNFNENDETFVFLLSTKAGGQGLNLTAADTVIFVDSDFNPQNDLQAAARAHRIGQSRPVKVIRLIGQNSIEEIILMRAEQKLKLTNKVIESGQFASAGKHSLFAENKEQLQDVLRFGVDKLLNANEDAVCDADFEKILGSSADGEWKLKEDVSPFGEEVMDGETAQSIYIFEGTDYSKGPTAADRKAFEKILEVERAFLTKQLAGNRSQRMRKENIFLGPMLELRNSKKLSPEELEERKRKVKDAAEKKGKLAREQETRRAEEQRQKREELWLTNNYTSCNLVVEEEDYNENEDETDSQDEDEARDRQHLAIQYVSGDVTRPSDAGRLNAIIVHCADDSGQWGQGGLFTALSTRSPLPKSQYELAGRMKDLALGDCHLIDLNKDQEDKCSHEWLALIIAQHRDKHNNLSGIKLSALRVGLEKIHAIAKKKKASVHLPRIGHNTLGFNWYGTERLIQKHLASMGIPTLIYYFPRPQKLKRKALSADSPASTPDDSVDTPSTSGEKTNKFLRRLKSKTESRESPCPQLTMFTGYCIHLHDIPFDDCEYFHRFIVAYNGNIHFTFQSSTTHLVITEGADKEVLKEATSSNPDVTVVTSQWLSDCLSSGRLLECDTYQILLE